MYEYVHGGDLYTAQKKVGNKKILDFSVNINPLGIPEGVKEAIKKAIEDCVNYPDPFCRELTRALAAYENTEPENILCANGASELIFRLPVALKPKNALLLAPTFADYEKALRTVDCNIYYYSLEPENDFSLQEDFLELLENRMDMIWICNPNNPTGQGTENALIKRVLEKSSKIRTSYEKSSIVIVDECFMDFVEEPQNYSVQNLIGSYNNLVILKAFTKAFAIPGIRLGYLLTTNKELINKLRLAGQDWSVSSLAQAAGVRALREEGYLQESLTLVKKERAFLKKELQALGFKVYGSLANYIFFYAPKHRELDKILLSKGFLIRSCANYRGLGFGYYRIAVKKHEDNTKLLDALEAVARTT
ncbi:MAG: threonine-phosphate decarboxylase CobD [Desulfitobacteriia bacterium]|jgi:threonine-phosphate decarboxylase